MNLVGQLLDKEYTTISGIPEFQKNTANLAFGEESGLVSDGLNATVQCISGTGSLRVGAAFFQKFFPSAKVAYLPTPSWANHTPIFKHAGFYDFSYFLFIKSVFFY